MSDVRHDPAVAAQMTEAVAAMQGRAYSREGLREELITVWGQGAAIGQKWLTDVLGAINPEKALLLLEELWEQRLSLPNDAARSFEERAARVIGVNAIREATPERLVASLRAIGVTDTVDILRNGDQASAVSSNEFTNRIALRLPLADFESDKLLRAVKTMLRRALPVKLSPSKERDVSLLATAADAQWGTATATDTRAAMLGRTALAAHSGPVFGTGRSIARKVRFGPRSIPTHADLNAALSYQFFPSVAGAGPGGHFAWISKEVLGNEVETILDADRSYSDRFIYVVGVLLETNILPGQLGSEANLDTTVGAHRFQMGMYGGNPSVVHESEYLAAGQGQFVVRTGQLRWLSDGATVDSRYLVALVWVSGPTGTYDATDADERAHAVYEDGDDWGDVTSADWAEAMTRSTVRAASGNTLSGSYPGDSALRRVAQVVGMEVDRDYVLDSSDDWRDRLISFDGIPITNSRWFGIEGDEATIGENRVFYSGPGSDGDLVDDTWIYERGGIADLDVWARDTDGALMARARGGPGISMGFVLTATGRLGEESTPPSFPAVVSGTGTVQSRDLNAPQDCGFFEQCRRGIIEGGNRPAAVETLPMGPVMAGNPPTSVEAVIVAQDGRSDFELDRARQVIADAARTSWFGEAPIGDTVIDATVDWRERFASVAGYLHTSDLGPGTLAFNWTSADHMFSGPIWTGSGLTYDLGDGVELRANASNGNLVLNVPPSAGGSRFTAFLIEATAQIRSPR